jgi:hypothetical protein
VYGVDTFTAVNLLAFNKDLALFHPGGFLTTDVAKWIFSVCIILSFINLAFEHIRANKIMRRGSVAECYLDNLAVRLESIRPGKGQGWKRFLVFAELTKSKKGIEYVALFTYFSFQCEFPPGPVTSRARSCADSRDSMDPGSCLFRTSTGRHSFHHLLGLQCETCHPGREL